MVSRLDGTSWLCPFGTLFDAERRIGATRRANGAGGAKEYVFVSISVSTRACHARKLGSTPRQRVNATFDFFFRVLPYFSTARTV